MVAKAVAGQVRDLTAASARAKGEEHNHQAPSGGGTRSLWKLNVLLACKTFPLGP